ncbi:MAG: hypothetical protein FD147_1629 [Chloroflexi bacterium]|nr:MAG: hypothetical protein FD147_1629 [Chloroflexota bacterium]
MPKKNYETTQPTKIDSSSEETKPIQAHKNIFKAPVKSDTTPTIESEEMVIEESKSKKTRRGKWVWLGILIMLLIAMAGSAIGYSSALKIRLAEETNKRLVLATTQFELALQDQQAGRLDMSLQRLKYILTIYSKYPGIDEKLKEVMLALALNQAAAPVTNSTAQPAITPVATRDTRATSVLLKQAQDQLAASDWHGLLISVNSLRDIDPKYEPIKVDGLLYYALRYNGVSKIQNGNLEVGLYYFAMAEQLAPIDTDAESYRTWAKMYLNAASWYGINWQKAANGFSQLVGLVPNLMDISGVTAKQRYAKSLEGNGDYLQATNAWCDAVSQYEASNGVLSNQGLVEKLIQARELCANPPATPTPTMEPDISTPIPTNAPE